MKFSHLFFAASLFTVTAASAQTTPLPNSAGTAPGAPGTTTASPSAVPSGVAPEQGSPRGAVSAGEVFTKGAPTNMSASDRRMKRQQNKEMKHSGKSKMKTTM